MKNLLWLVPFSILFGFLLLINSAPSKLSAAIPTPSPGAMTIYRVTNPNAVPLDSQHTFVNAQATPVYAFNSSVPANSGTDYHVRDISQVVSPFNGSVIITSTMPFGAEVIDYDYPPTPTPTIYKITLPVIK